MIFVIPALGTDVDGLPTGTEINDKEPQLQNILILNQWTLKKAD